MKRAALGLLALAMALSLAMLATATSITGLDTYSAMGITFQNPALVLAATGSLGFC
jgi:hypothetical protein